MRTPLRLLLALLFGLYLAACETHSVGPTDEVTSAISSNPSLSGGILARSQPLPTPTAVPTPTSTPEPTQAQLRLVIWWAAELLPTPGSAAETVLNAQFAGFRNSPDAPSLIVRAKRSEGVGGILSTLRSASRVAPGALPDLALLRRADLPAAARDRLIAPLSASMPAALRRNLTPAALALGTVEDVVYGVAYLLEVQHVVYRPAAFETPPLTFAAVLDAGQPFAFPLGGEDGVNTALLIPYAVAGGQLADEAGAPVLDEAPLRTVLEFYEQAVAAGLIGPEALAYHTAEDYWDAFLDGAFDLAQVDSSIYLTSSLQQMGLVAAPPITTTGEARTCLDGWLWVMTTSDPDRQAGAWRLLEWLMQAERQAAFAQAMNRVPSLESALALWNAGDYGALMATLLANDTPILAGNSGPAVETLQAALEAVINGEQSAAEAAEAATGSTPS